MATDVPIRLKATVTIADGSSTVVREKDKSHG